MGNRKRRRTNPTKINQHRNAASVCLLVHLQLCTLSNTSLASVSTPRSRKERSLTFSFASLLQYPLLPVQYMRSQPGVGSSDKLAHAAASSKNSLLHQQPRTVCLCVCVIVSCVFVCLFLKWFCVVCWFAVCLFVREIVCLCGCVVVFVVVCCSLLFVVVCHLLPVICCLFLFSCFLLLYFVLSVLFVMFVVCCL